MILKFTSPIPPSVNHYLGWRAVMMHGHPTVVSYQTKEAKEYKEVLRKIVQESVREQCFVPDEIENRHYYVDCVFYFARIDQDSSNYDKCLLDAIKDTKLIWNDDNAALVRTQGVFYDKQNPRIEIEIRPVDYIGIFKSMREKDDFCSQCALCTRGNRVCSIRSDAVAGRVSDLIECGQCKKFKKKK